MFAGMTPSPAVAAVQALHTQVIESALRTEYVASPQTNKKTWNSSPALSRTLLFNRISSHLQQK